MASKPSSKPAWVPSDDPAKVIEPSTSKKSTGWEQEEKPPFQYFNWFWNTLSKWVNYLSGNVKYNIIIDSDTDEGDFTTLASYLAGSPASGDRVLVRVDETIAATLVIPNGVLIHQQKGKIFTTTTAFTPLVSLGTRAVLEGDFKVNTSHIGTITKGLSILSGSGCLVDNFILTNLSSGVITNGISLESGADTSRVIGEVTNTGAGSITNPVVDSSGNATNQYNIRHDTGVFHQSINATTLGGSAAALYAKLVSPIFTGNPTAPTQSVGNDSTRLASTAFVQASKVGSSVRVVNSQDGAVATGATVLPTDDTIPQNTEGNEYMALAITPTKATNELKIEIVAQLSQTNTVAQIAGALFKDSTANALAAGLAGRASFANARTCLKFTHYMVAGTTSPITFKLRAGSATAGTTTFNGTGGSRTFGGVAASSITITETEV